MIRQVSLALILTTFSAQSMAQQAKLEQSSGSKQETIGFLSGLSLGAAVGGPPGAIIGSLIGTVIGNAEAKSSKLEFAQSELLETQQLLAEVRSESRRLESAYNGAQQQLNNITQEREQLIAVRDAAAVNIAPLSADNTQFSIHFRSGSAQIEPHYHAQLSSITQLAKQLPGYVIEISGHTDRTGDTAPNRSLSLQRGEAVKASLERMGVQDLLIRVSAQGESKPLRPIQSLESDFFDRRVQVRLLDPSRQLLSRSNK